MVWDTNALRREADQPAFEVDLGYRELEDEAALQELLELWAARFEKALKKSYWWKLALCESGGDWEMKADYRGQEYHGGLSFHPQTWADYRSKGLPRFAYQATPGEQIRVARKVLADQGWEAWPACSAKLGLR